MVPPKNRSTHRHLYIKSDRNIPKNGIFLTIWCKNRLFLSTNRPEKYFFWAKKYRNICDISKKYHSFLMVYAKKYLVGGIFFLRNTCAWCPEGAMRVMRIMPAHHACPHHVGAQQERKKVPQRKRELISQSKPVGRAVSSIRPYGLISHYISRVLTYSTQLT